MPRNPAPLAPALCAAVLCLLLLALPARAAAPAAENPAAPTVPIAITITGHITDEKVIFLTFDDGPHAPYTQQVLDALAEFDARATFFVVGRQAAADPDMLKTIHDAGHGLANHTYDHANLSGAGWQTFQWQVGSTAEALGDMDSMCLRPPYGAIDDTVLTNAQKMGYTVVKWNVDPRDWTSPGSGVIASHVIGHATPGAIVVLHDGGGNRSQTVSALRVLIPRLQREGYTFKALCRDVTPEQLVAAAAGQPAPALAAVEIYPLTPAPTPTPSRTPTSPIDLMPALVSPMVSMGLAQPPPAVTRIALAPGGPPLAPAAPAALPPPTATPEPTPVNDEASEDETSQNETSTVTTTAPSPVETTPKFGGISAPLPGAQVSGTVEVRGFAQHPQFDKWQLDLVLASGEVVFLALGEEPLSEADTLFVWESGQHPNGAHMLRLRVVHEGNYQEYFVHVIVAN